MILKMKKDYIINMEGGSIYYNFDDSADQYEENMIELRGEK